MAESFDCIDCTHSWLGSHDDAGCLVTECRCTEPNPYRPPVSGEPRRHQWVVMATYAVTDAEARAIHQPDYEQRLDAEHRLSIDGPGCLNCEQAWSQSVARSPCPTPWHHMKPNPSNVRQL